MTHLTSHRPADTVPIPPPLAVAEFEHLIGETLDVFELAVAHAGGIVRVVEVGGVAQAMSLDYAPRRLNVGIVGTDRRVIAITGVG